MKTNRTISQKTFDIMNIILLGILVLATLYPFYFITIASISEAKYIENHTGLLLKPLGFSLKAYELVIRNPMVLVGYKNTVIYVMLGTVINMFMTSLGAYTLSRKDVYWSKLIMFVILFTMYFTGGMIPTYLLVSALGWLNKIWAIIMPTAIWSWNLIVMRTSFKNVPYSVEESARIDGANDFTILFKIFIPLSLPIMAVMTMFYAVGNWNSWFPAAIYLSDRSKYPLQLILREILIYNSTDSMLRTMSAGGDRTKIAATLKYATIIVATLPIVFIYPFLQKYFIKGIMIGSIKG